MPIAWAWWLKSTNGPPTVVVFRLLAKRTRGLLEVQIIGALSYFVKTFIFFGGTLALLYLYTKNKVRVTYKTTGQDTL